MPNTQPRRNTPVVVALVALLVVAVAGVAVWLSRRPAVPTPDTLRLGAILPLTGESAYIGTSIKNGMEIASQELGAAGLPFRLQIDYLDSGGSPARVVTAYQSLVNLTDSQAIIAAQEGVKGLIPLAGNDRRVLLATSVPDNGISGVNPWTFRFFINAKTDTEKMARYAVEKLKKKSFAMLYVNDGMGVSYRDGFRETVTSLGARVVAEESFGPADTDYRTQVLKIKAAKPDAVYLVAYGKSLSNIPIQLREAGVKATLLSVGTISQPEIMKAAGDAVEGCYYTTAEFFTFAPATPELKGFVDAYKAKYGQTPVFFEVFGYDAVKLLVHAAQAGSRDPEALRSALMATKDLPLASGKVTVGADGEVQFPVVVKVIRNGQWTMAE